MAVGDLVHWELQNFTPASGVEVMCMWVETGAGAARYWGFESAAGVSYCFYVGDSNASNSTVSGIRLGINNTYFFHNFDAGMGGCGVQTQ